MKVEKSVQNQETYDAYFNVHKGMTSHQQFLHLSAMKAYTLQQFTLYMCSGSSSVPIKVPEQSKSLNFLLLFSFIKAINVLEKFSWRKGV